MKAKSSNPLLFVLRRFFAAQAIFISFLGVAQAANSNVYWDGGTADIAAVGDGASAGATTGNWNTTTKNWDVGSGVAHAAWVNANNDIAFFAGIAGTVTLTTPTANGLNFGTTGYTLTGSTLTLAGSAPTVTVGTSLTATINSIIAGTTGLTKAGAGTVILGAANTFTGGATVNAGELQALMPTTAATYTYLSSGTVTVNSGATLRVKTGSTANALTVANALNLNTGTVIHDDGNFTLSGAVALTGANTISGNWAGKNLTMSGVISGGGSINKTNTAGQATTLTLSATNTFTGGITLTAGTLQVAAAANLGSGALSFPTAGTTFSITGTAVTLPNNISLGAVAGNITIVTPSTSATILNGTISGGGASTVWFFQGGAAGANTGALTLNGTNTLAGVIDVERGPLILGNAAAAGTTTIKLNSNNNPSGALQLGGNFTIANNVASTFAPSQRLGVGSGLSAGISGVISSADATAGIEKVGAGTLTLSGANTLTSSTTVTAGTLKLDYTTQANSKLSDTAALVMAGGTLDLAGTNAVTHAETVGSTTVTGTSSITRSGSSLNTLVLGAITSAGGSLNFVGNSLATTTSSLTNNLLPGFITVNGGLATKDGSNFIIAATGLTDVNRLGGSIADGPGSNVRIVEGGLSGNVALVGYGTTTIGTLANAGTLAPTAIDLGVGNILRLNDMGTILAGSNGLTISNGTLTAGGVADTAGLIDFVNSSATATTISSAIGDNGAGVVSLLKSGTGGLILGGANTYTGTTTVNGGLLALAGGNAIANTGAVTLANNAGVTLRLDASETIGSLTGGAQSTVNLQGNALTLGDATDTTYSGIITGTLGSLIKSGSGALTLSGANTFTGGVNLTTGTLLAAVSTTAANGLGTGPVVVAGGTTAQLNITNISTTTPVIGNVFTGTGLLKLNFTANTTARNTTMNNVTGFTGTIQLSNAGATGDKWTMPALGTIGAAVIVDSGSQLYASAGTTTFTNGITALGIGNSELRGAIRLIGTLGGNITLAGDTTIGAEGGVITGGITSGVPATLTVGTTASTGNSTFTGVIGGGAGTIALTKVAAGTMTLAGANTYTGATNITAGTLNLTGSIASSAVTLAAGTTLRGEGTIGGLTATTTSNLILDPSTASALTTGPLSLGGVMTVSLVGGSPTSGTFRVLNYTGADPLPANFALANAASYRSPTFSATAGAVDLTVGMANLTWTGTGGLNWDVKTTSNWKDTTPAASQFYFNDAVTFDDSAGANQTVTLTVAVQPSSITFNNSTYSYTLTAGAGSISGTTGITKNGTNTVTLGGATAQNYTGPIAVNAGVLKMGSAAAFGLTSGVTVANNAQVDINGQSPGTVATGGYTYNVIGNGPDGAGAIVNTGASVASNAGVKTLNLTGNASLGVVATSRFDIGFANAAGYGTVNGNGYTLTKLGAGQLDFRGDASATPINIVINQGDAWAEDNNLALGGTTGTVTVNNGGRIGTYGARTIATPVVINTGGALYNQGNGTGTWTGALTFADGTSIDTGVEVAIAGTATFATGGTLAKTGTTQLTISGSLTSSGATLNANAGTVQVGNLGTTGALTGFTTVNLGAGVLFRDRLSGANNTISSNFNFNNTTSEVRQHSGLVGDTLTLTGTIGTTTTTGILRTTFGRMVLGSGANATVNMVAIQGAPASGPGVIEVKTGATLTSPWFNIGQDGTNSGILNVTGGTVTALTGGTGVRFGHWNNGSTTIGSELNVSAGIFDASAATLVTNIGWDGLAKMTVGGAGSPALAKVYQLQLDANGDSTTYNDTATLLPNGTLEIGAGGTASPSANDYVILNGGTITGTAAATWAARMDVTAATTSFIGANAGITVTQTGALTGTGLLTKVGAGNLVLTGGTFPGSATATGGTLFLGTTAWTAASFGTSPGGVVQPSTPVAAGTSTVPNFAFNGGTAAFRVGDVADKLVAPNVTVTSPSAISVIPGNVLSAGSSFTVIDYTGTVGGSGVAGLIFASANPHLQGTVHDDTTLTEIYVTIDTADYVTWAGNVDGNWNVNSTANWLLGSDGTTASKFYDYDVVVFDDSGLATNPTVTLVGTITPATVAIDNTSGTYTFQGTGITGGAKLTKTGAGAVVILNNNVNTGLVTISDGSVTVGNGGTTGLLGGSGSISLTNGTLAFNRSDAQTLARTITGTNGVLVKNGAGTLTMSSGNNTCDITVNNGTLAARGGDWATSFAGNRTITVNAPGILDTATHTLGGLGGATRPNNVVINEDAIWKLNNEQQLPNTALTLTAGIVNGPGEIRGGGTIATVAHATKSSVINAPINNGNGSVTFNVADGAVAADLLVAGGISNINTISKTGAGTMVLTGNNTYTGGTAVNGGTLEVSSIADAGGVGSIGAYTGGAGLGYLGIGNDSTFRYTGTGTEATTRYLWIDTGTQTKTLEVTNAGASILFNSTGGNINKPFRKTGPGALAIVDTIQVGATVTVEAGTLTLYGANTYTGDTIVNGGTLVVTGASILDSNALTITGGKVQPTSDETVDKLFFGSAQQAAGTWGSSASTATHKDDTHFAGTAVVNVVSGPPGFAAWITGFGLSVADQAPTADPDGDGLNNLLEYALGGLPNVNDAATIGPKATKTGSNLIVTFLRSDLSETDTTMTVEYGSDLTGWTSVPIGASPGSGIVVIAENADAPDSVTVTIPTGGATRLFTRVKVVK